MLDTHLYYQKPLRFKEKIETMYAEDNNFSNFKKILTKFSKCSFINFIKIYI